MSTLAPDTPAGTLEELRAQLASLAERIARLEHPESLQSAQTHVTNSPAKETDISPEIILAISAAVAAFLGERGHIRAIRLAGSSRWAQQGRVNIQASHRLNRM